jgi:hypothetical protein
MYADDANHVAPISIIITTVCAQLYNNEDNIFDTLKSILENANNYVNNKMIGSLYHIDNPSYTGPEIENFADKWNEHPERADAFFEWIENAKSTLIDIVNNFDSDIDVGNELGMALGDTAIQKAFSNQPIIVKELSQKAQEPVYELIPYKEKKILAAPHKQKAPWTLPKGNRVLIRAIVTNTNGETFQYKNDGGPLDKAVSINFTACFGGIRNPFNVRWQIVNTGYDAEQVNDLRGEFESSNSGKFTHSERTSYSGVHSIQCFVTQYNQCVAKSGIFIVNIK